MVDDFEIIQEAFGGGKKSKNITPKKVTPKKQFTKNDLKYFKKGLKAYLSTYKGNLKQWQTRHPEGDPRDSDAFDELKEVMFLYKKLTGRYYFNEKLYKLMKIEKGEDLENVK